ncbi:OLC1v1032671C5 [Oldenlandia corymbosa var. corymbosa]|nr:OLC1v1032671C5 [Oldenlandia corymbosa var. corymbosa]
MEMEIDSAVSSKPNIQIKAGDLFKAAEKGDVSLFESLPEEQFLKALALRNEDDRSLLHVAVSFGQTQIVKLLSSAKPSSICGVNSVDEEGWGPLHSAASSGNLEIVEVLLDTGADVNLKNNGGRTAIHYAASKGWLKIAELLVSHGAKLNAKDKVGCTALHRAASIGNSELCEYLIEEGAEVDEVDRAGQTPLMNAVICGNKEVALLLIRHGANVDIEDKEGFLQAAGLEEVSEEEKKPKVKLKSPIMASSIIMVSSIASVSAGPCLPLSKPSSAFKILSMNPEKCRQGRIGFTNKTQMVIQDAAASLRKVQLVSLAASAAFLLSSSPATAGILSGFPGIESVPGPELPKVEFIERWNEENQKRYAENDERFKQSPILKKLLEQSKLNKEKNRQATFDKYCIRGAEWGVGDCSADAMSPEDRENFIAMLKKKAGVEPGAATTNRGGLPTDSGDSVVTLDQVPRWSDGEYRYSYENEASSYFADPLTSVSDAGGSGNGLVSRFPVDHEINSKIYLWRGNPWNLEVDAVVNSTNENLDEAHSSPGLHAAAGPGLAEECASLGGCRTGMAKVTNAYDLPARRVIHTVGPKYAVKYHTAAENALSHCYRACLELLIENGLESIAVGCIYTEAKNYPREPAAHVAIRTVRRFLEKQKDKIKAVVFCTTTAPDTEIYKRLLPLYFPRDKQEEEIAISKLPADVGDENGETVIDERKIRIKPLPNVKKSTPKPPQTPVELPTSDVGLTRRSSSYLESYLDPAFMSLIKDPDQRRKEQWEKTAQAQSGWNCFKMLGYGDLGGPPLSAAEEYSLHSRYLAKANSLNLSEIAEMKIVYRGGVDSEGRPVMVIVGAHFLLRCLDLERFILYVVKEFEPLIQKPYTIVYFHSAASLQP